MDVVKSTVKGQILIPATLRKKYKIERGTSLRKRLSVRSGNSLFRSWTLIES